MAERSTLDAWTEVCQALFPGKEEYRRVCPLHSCVINGARHFFHAPDLTTHNPQGFEHLANLSRQQGIRLQADRRKLDDNSDHECRRKKILPVLFLALGSDVNWSFTNPPRESENATSNLPDPYQDILDTLPDELSFDSDRDQLHSQYLHNTRDAALTQAIENILLTHFVAQADDPESIYSEIHALAHYYSRHPETVVLIEAIMDQDWELKFAPFTFQTDLYAADSHAYKKNISVYFDPRASTKLAFYDRHAVEQPFCSSSPADALLHEFLQVHTATNDSIRLFAKGAKSGALQPSLHEHLTLQKEQRLFQAMTRRDRKPRPDRSQHKGRHVLVACANSLA